MNGVIAMSGLLLDTDVVTFVFEPTTSPTATGRANADLVITGTAYTERLEDKTLALIFDVTAAGDLEGRWYSYTHISTTRSQDIWRQIGSGTVTVSSMDAVVSEGTVVKTYTFSEDGALNDRLAHG